MVRKSILHSKLTDVHLRSFSWQIEFFLPFLEPMSLALAIFHLHEHNTSGFEVSGMVHCVHWENALVPKRFQKYKVPATFEEFVASLKNLQHNFPKMRGGSKAVWNFSKNSSILVTSPVHYWKWQSKKKLGIGLVLVTSHSCLQELFAQLRRYSYYAPIWKPSVLCCCHTFWDLQNWRW